MKHFVKVSRYTFEKSNWYQTQQLLVWRRMPITMQGISYSVINRGRQGTINTLRGNIFSSTVVGCGVLVAISSFVFASSALDKLIATFQAAIMFYLAAPTAMALSKLVLQTTPKGLGNGIEGKLREVKAVPKWVYGIRDH
jgi:hypothetical protein